MTTVFRLFRPNRKPGDAAGAYKWGGRWNNPGTAVLYTASSLSLACLEVLVHIRDVNNVPDLVYSTLDIPDEWIGRLEGTPAWIQARVDSLVLSREEGDFWIRERRAPFPGSKQRPPVLQVPSIVIPQEANYLVDPEDAVINKLGWSTPQPFHFEPRLLDPSLR